MNERENIPRSGCLYEPLLPMGYKADQGWRKIKGVGHEGEVGSVVLAQESLLP